MHKILTVIASALEVDNSLPRTLRGDDARAFLSEGAFWEAYATAHTARCADARRAMRRYLYRLMMR